MILLLCALTLSGAGAQNNMADILSCIEANNPQLKAGAQMVLSQKAEVSSQNSLADPTFELEHLWGAQNAGDRKYDITVLQSFDFPSLYVQRNRVGNLKRSLYDGQQTLLRQQVLLCLRMRATGLKPLHRAERQAAGCGRRTGPALPGQTRIGRCRHSRREQNRNRTAQCHHRQHAAAQRTRHLSGSVAGLERAARRFDVELSTLIYPEAVLPASFDELKTQALQADPRVAVVAAGEPYRRTSRWLSTVRAGCPKFELGYPPCLRVGRAVQRFAVGVSIPLFANRKKVKMAKAQALAGTLCREQSRTAGTGRVAERPMTRR